MYAGVVAQLGVESCSHDFSLSDGDRVVIFALGSDYFNFGADAFDLWSADEDHFDRLTTESAFADRAVDLTAVGVAADADIERAQSGLLWVFYFVG